MKKAKAKPKVSWTRRILAVMIVGASMGTLTYLAIWGQDPLNKIALGAIIGQLGSVVTFYFLTKE